MPRKKLIDEENIKFEKIDLDIIEKKNCLGVKLVFNTPMGQRQLHTMRTFYKITTDETGLTAIRSTKNSWKGLVMLLLSLTYCKYGNQVMKTIMARPYSKGGKYKSYLPINDDFTAFLDKKILSDIQPTMVCTPEEAILSLLPETREQQRRIFQQRRKERFKASLLNLPPQPNFEQIPAPPSWKAFYIMGKYEPNYIKGDMVALAELLDLDVKNSIITTDYYKTAPYNYIVTPAKYQNREGLLCSCPGEFRFVYGIEIVDDKKFSLLHKEKYAQEIDPSISPQQIGEGETSIFGYNICDHTVKRLCSYFPFMESEFHEALIRMGGRAWVIFDSKHLGKWG